MIKFSLRKRTNSPVLCSQKMAALQENILLSTMASCISKDSRTTSEVSFNCLITLQREILTSLSRAPTHQASRPSSDTISQGMQLTEKREELRLQSHKNRVPQRSSKATLKSKPLSSECTRVALQGVAEKAAPLASTGPRSTTGRRKSNCML